MFFRWFEAQLMYCCVYVGFLYTFVMNVPSDLVISTSKNGMNPSCSSSILNWIFISTPFKCHMNNSNSSFVPNHTKNTPSTCLFHNFRKCLSELLFFMIGEKHKPPFFPKAHGSSVYTRTCQKFVFRPIEISGTFFIFKLSKIPNASWSQIPKC